MRTPMPSPRNTNLAKLFLPSNPKGAYDAMPDDAAAALVAFLTGKLSDQDLAEFCKMAGIDAGITMDDERDPEPLGPLPDRFGQDSAMSATLARIRANSNRIKIS